MNIKLFKMFFILTGAIVLSATAESLEYSGIVLTDIGRRAANATVTVENLADRSKRFVAVTDTTGRFSFSIETAVKEQPIPFQLYGNFPNPFNPQTRISYSIDNASDVTISIYNILGRRVCTMDQGYREPGFYTAVWDGRGDSGNSNSAGVYLYKLDAGGRSITSKMLMVDSSAGSWINAKLVPVNTFKKNEEILYLITVVQPDAETLSLGPMTLNETDEVVLTINRIMTKMQLVKGATFLRGTDKRWYPNLYPAHKVKISRDYLMDKYEVTAGVFSDVMNFALSRGDIVVDSLLVKNTIGDSQILLKLDTPERWTNICVEFRDGAFIPKVECEKSPITFVSWYGAIFFCYERNIMKGLPQAIDVNDWSCDFKSTGYRLPTDCEWALAAKSTELREYPFGKDPGYYKPMNTQLNDDGFNDILAPVGWFSPQGDSYDGVSDMGGNVYEWIWDWRVYYKISWLDSLLVDPTGPENGKNKTCRGGSAYGCFRTARNFDKAHVLVSRTSHDIGFRTVRTADN
ncbi:MAG: SUMF1/EgtB/PvdO family nonheme iron enzyme [Candidatus Latescibacteria bacterium]|jgi:formylglycine-generating enzyme required for sulfatase activity|nr:SUMF1/EgtB/PvdO family nonheme iron enzyme [Candidatus Latescibacterota bacterium]